MNQVTNYLLRQWLELAALQVVVSIAFRRSWMKSRYSRLSNKDIQSNILTPKLAALLIKSYFVLDNTKTTVDGANLETQGQS